VVEVYYLPARPKSETAEVRSHKMDLRFTWDSKVFRMTSNLRSWSRLTII
jgi:hypothetical protein